jgi:FecR protein
MRALTLRKPWLSHCVPVLVLALALTLACERGFAAQPGAADLEITVVAVQGEVNMSMQGTPHAVHKGDVVLLPVTVYTGPTGSIELRQGRTTLSAAPNSELSIPAPTAAGEAIDRIAQSRGSAFYSVAKREVRKLHVETAYLVAVVKGTQFSVVAQDDSTTVSLFEGLLEVRATDYSDVVELEAGEIAIRHAGDSTIRMLRMDTGDPIARNIGSSALAGTTADANNVMGAGAAASTLIGQPGTAGAGVTAAAVGGTTLAPVAAHENWSGATTGFAATAATPGASTESGLTAAAGPTGLTASAATNVATPVVTSAAGLTSTTGSAGTTAGVSAGVTTPVAPSTVAATVAVGGSGLGVGVSTSVTGTTAVNLGTTATGTASPAPSVTSNPGTSTTNPPAANPMPNPVGTLIGNTPSPLKTLLGH